MRQDTYMYIYMELAGIEANDVRNTNFKLSHKNKNLHFTIYFLRLDYNHGVPCIGSVFPTNPINE